MMAKSVVLAAALLSAAFGIAYLHYEAYMLNSRGFRTMEYPKKIRVASYNIAAGRDSTGTVNLRGIANDIIHLSADLVALQEVDKLTNRSGNVDQLAVLSQMTGMNYSAFGQTMEYDNGGYGIAVLSMYPILQQDFNIFQAVSDEPRGVLAVKVKPNPRGETFWFCSTHLAEDEGEEILTTTSQVSELRRFTATLSAAKDDVVVAGDFNAMPGERPILEMSKSFTDSWRFSPSAARNSRGATWPSTAPERRIDYIFIPKVEVTSLKKRRFEFQEFRTSDAGTSDHLAVLLIAIFT